MTRFDPLTFGSLAGLWTIGALGPVSPALAQEVGDRLEAEPIASLTVVVATATDDDGGGVGSAEGALGELELGGRIAYVLDNGAEIGGRLVWRGQRDHPGRPGGAGIPVPSPVFDAVPNGSGNVAAPMGRAGAFTGLATGASARSVGARGSVESAFVFVRGGYGELSAGRDTGVAARFQEGQVDVFSMTGVADVRLDPSGISTAITRADLTGPAEKVSYTTPRLLGLRAGVSYTPVAERAGLDRNPVFGADVVPRPEISDAWEAGLNFSRRFRESGLRVRAGLGYAAGTLQRAQSDDPALGDRVEVMSIGGEIERGSLRFGASALRSDDGFRGDDFSAWTVGSAYALEDWSASVTLSRSDAPSQQLETDGLSIGLSRSIGPNGTLTFGYQGLESKLFAQGAGTVANRGGIVIELSLSL